MQFSTFLRLRIRQLDRLRKGGRGGGNSLEESLLAAQRMEG